MPELLSSKVVIVEEEPRIRGVPALPSAVLAIIGRFERGPVGVPTRVTSYAEFVEIFGAISRVGSNLYFYAPMAVRAFFLNGGQQAWILRTVHYTDLTNPATLTALRAGHTFLTGATAPGGAQRLGTNLGPFAVEHGDTLHAAWSHDAGVSSASRTAEIYAVAAVKDSAAVGAGFNFTVLGASPWSFRVRVNGVTQTVTLVAADFADPAAATVAEVVAALGARLRNVSVSATGAGAAAKVRLTTDRRGTSASLEVIPVVAPLLDGNTALGYTTGAATLGDGYFKEGATTGGAIANAEAVTVAELETGLEAIFNAAGLPAGNLGIDVTTSGGALLIKTVNTGTVARLAIGDASVNLATIFGLTTVAEAGGIDLATPEAGVAQGTSGAAVNTLLVEGKDPGAYGNELGVEVVNATRVNPATGVADTAYFNLNVYRNNLLVEQHPDVTMDATSTDYVEARLNRDGSAGGSVYVRVTDQDAVGTTAQRRPANVAAAGLTGGSDGDAIVTGDYTGSAAGLTGIWALQGNEEVTLFICPDAAAMSAGDCAVVQNAIAAYVDETRGREGFVIDDAPASTLTSQSAVLAHRANLVTREVAALYWPWVTIPNPAATVLRTAGTPPLVSGNPDIVVVPPSGFIAGMMARLDANTSEGAFHQPAGEEDGRLTGAVGVYGPWPNPAVLRTEVRDVVFPHRVNPIVVFTGTGVHIDGARTLKGDGQFPSVGERRGVSMVERAVKSALRFAKNRNNTADLRAAVHRTIQSYLLGLCRNRCFASTDPRKAFFVDVSDALNTPSVVASGRLLVRIGMATAKPAEFIIVNVSQDTRALEEELRR